MGDRYRDYGFTNPFRSNRNGSNYNSSYAYLANDGIDQWFIDLSTYNKILADYEVQSQIEYKQPDGSWGPTPPANASTTTLTYKSGSSQGSSVQIKERYILGAPKGGYKNGVYYAPKEENAVKTLPEYRWKMTGDVDGANQALRAAGLQGSYGKKYTGAYIPNFVDGKKVNALNAPKPNEKYSKGSAGTFYITSADPLGAALDGAGDALGRYSGGAAPTFRYSPLSPFEANYWATTHDIAKEFFADPNLAAIRTNPSALNTVLKQNPQIRNTVGKYIEDTAAYWRSRDDGGGPLGVIAGGLGQVAQFLGMAAGLHGITAGLGALTSGGGLAGAWNAGTAAAGGMPSIGSVAGNIAGAPGLSSAINSGIGAFTGGVNGGLSGGALGALTGYIGGVPGAILDSVGSLAGIGQTEKKFDQIAPLNLSSMTFPAISAEPTTAEAVSTPASVPAASPMTAASAPAVPVSSAGSVPSAIAASSQATPQLSSTGLLGNLPLQSGLQQVMLSRPMQGGMLSSVPLSGGPVNPFLGGGIGGGGMSRGPVAPINQLSMLANLPQVLARMQGANPNISLNIPTMRIA